MRLLFIIILTLITISNLYSQFNFSSLDPLQKWKKTETKHFEIYFSENSSNTAMKLSTICDEIYEILSDKMKVKFSYKFPVIVVNQSDLPNGYYSPIPYPYILIYTSTISKLNNFYFDNDIKGVFTHELTHALAIEEAKGIWEPFRFIFGYYIAPNLYLPGIFIESITVFNESTWGYGRLNNPIFKDTIYSQAYYGKFRSFYNANLVSDFPTDTWYSYGGLFFYYLYQKYGYDKIIEFYRKNIYYLPGFFYFSFYETFNNNIFSEWEEFKNFISNKVISRKQYNNLSQLTYDGGYKQTLKTYDNFLIYIQKGIKGELTSLKYLNLKTKKVNHLLYGRYIYNFDIKSNILAFIEIQYSKYHTYTILKIAKITNISDKLKILDEKTLNVKNLYYITIIDDNNLLGLLENDSKYYLVKISIPESKIKTLIESDEFIYKVKYKNNQIYLVIRNNAKDNIRVLSEDLAEVITEIKDFEQIEDIFFTEKLIISAVDEDKIDIFEYDIDNKTIKKIISSTFSFFSPVEKDGKFYGISLSKNGFDIFSTDRTNQDFERTNIHKLMINSNLANITTKTTNLDYEEYGFFNKITPLSILLSFFPTIVFGDGYVKKLGVMFDFYDIPLEFRNFFISFFWNYDSETIDYEFKYRESGIPYTLFEINITRDHITTNEVITKRLISRGYTYNIFTFDYISSKITGIFHYENNLIKPFLSFSLSSFVGRSDTTTIFPDYKIGNSTSSLLTTYFTLGFVFSSLTRSLGAITPEEGIYNNINIKISSKNLFSIEDSILFNLFLSYSMRLWANNVIRFGINSKHNIFSSVDGVFTYYGYRYQEIFPVQETEESEINLKSYYNYNENGNNYTSFISKLYIKFFEINEGIWPIYITSIFSEFGLKGGILFNSLEEIRNRYLRIEGSIGIFCNLNLIGTTELKTGIEWNYNFDSNIWLFDIIFDIEI